MSQTRLSKSKTRVLIKAVPSADILHKGYQRKIAQSEYIKTFPKMKLRLNSRANTASISQNQISEEYILAEIENMKVENKRLEEMNQDLLARIRKESKFNEIYEKKIERVGIQQMSFEKIVEIKLLLQVEELEESLRIKEEAVSELVKGNKKKKEMVQTRDLEHHVELHAILMSYEEIEDLKYEREKNLKRAEDRLDELYEKRQMLSHSHKQKQAQLNNTKISIERQHASASTLQEVVQQSNENSFIAGVNRTKSIEDTQQQIQRLQQQYKQYEIKVQQQVDSKVKQKLTIMKQMQQITSKMQRLKNYNRNRSLRVAW